jgi:hypothetical protein
MAAMEEEWREGCWLAGGEGESIEAWLEVGEERLGKKCSAFLRGLTFGSFTSRGPGSASARIVHLARPVAAWSTLFAEGM